MPTKKRIAAGGRALRSVLLLGFSSCSRSTLVAMDGVKCLTVCILPESRSSAKTQVIITDSNSDRSVLPITTETAADYHMAGKAADARLQELHWPLDLVQ